MKKEAMDGIRYSVCRKRGVFLITILFSLVLAAKSEAVYVDPATDLAVSWSCIGSGCSTGSYAVIDDGIRQPNGPDTTSDYLYCNEGDLSGSIEDQFQMTTASGMKTVSNIKVWSYGRFEGSDSPDYPVVTAAINTAGVWSSEIDIKPDITGSWKVAEWTGCWDYSYLKVQLKCISGQRKDYDAAYIYAMYAELTGDVCAGVNCDNRDGYYCNGAIKEYRDHQPCSCSNSDCSSYSIGATTDCSNDICLGGIAYNQGRCSLGDCTYTTSQDCSALTGIYRFCGNNDVYREDRNYFCAVDSAATPDIAYCSYTAQRTLEQDCTDDGLSCTYECSVDHCVSSTISPGYCVINGVCYTNGQTNPANQCQTCDSSVRQTAWTNRIDGTSCNDNQYCTTDDRCSAGSCIATPNSRNCNDGVSCTVDSCNEATDGCVNTPQDNLCPSDTSCADYYCDATLDCQVNYQPSTTVCKVAAGFCDIEEKCTGSSADCPTDQLRPSTYECRTAAGICDIAENCDGINANCPLNLYKSDGTGCSNGLWCDGTETCYSGVCQSGTAPSCVTDSVSCTVCDENSDSCVIAQNQCYIGGLCYIAGNLNAECQECNPSISQTQWWNNNNRCSDKCEGNTRLYDGSCNSGICQYNNENCLAQTCVSSLDIKIGQGCSLGTCIYATQPCDDFVDCTINSCNQATNRCEYTPDNNRCTDTSCADYYCDSSLGCGVASYYPSGTVCKAAAGFCDIEEKCTGSSADCPTDQLRPSTYECRTAAGICDIAEYCTGSNANCPIDSKSTAVCRAAANQCDIAENCDGINNNCPVNRYQIEGTPCDDRCNDNIKNFNGYCSAGACTYPDSTDCTMDWCNGNERKYAGYCALGNCIYSGQTCPYYCVGGICRDCLPGQTQLCQKQQGVCQGSQQSCLNYMWPGCDYSTIPGYQNTEANCADGLDNDCDGSADRQDSDCYECFSDSQCLDKCDDKIRKYNGKCISGFCQYTSEDCSLNYCNGNILYRYGQCNPIGCTYESMTCNDFIPCTTDSCSQGSCVYTPDNNRCTDTSCADYYCDSSLGCGVASYYPSGTVCKAAAGFCDIEEKCTGSSADCPTDQLRPSTYECRTAAGICDIAEYCTGSNANCPIDSKSTAVCRAAANQCDIAENCDGINNNCPVNRYQIEGTPCDDRLYCNMNEVCLSGQCTNGQSKNCADNNDYYCANNLTIEYRNYVSCTETSDCSIYTVTETRSCNNARCDGNDIVNEYKCESGVCLTNRVRCQYGCSAGLCLSGNCTPLTEVCDGIDNDCDILIDEDSLGNSLNQSCYTGENRTIGVGICKAGIKTCTAGSWGDCIGEIRPRQEFCGNGTGDGKDNDCDGKIDEDCFCVNGATQTCGTGRCTGRQTCVNNRWGECDSDNKDCGVCCICRGGGEGYDENQDSDCIATACPTDSGCGIGCGENIWGGYISTEQNFCQSSGACTQNQCSISCELDSDNDSYSFSCGDCNDNSFSINPVAAEQCDGTDNDCDNETDENLLQGCGINIGICEAGYQLCQGGVWGRCVDEVKPLTEEVCNNGLDDDCDDDIDEECKCKPGETQGCGIDTGECRKGLQLCKTNARWGECVGQIKKHDEICNGLDDDCDDRVDELLSDCQFSCGNDICDISESCESCAYDCGECKPKDIAITFGIKANSITTRIFSVVDLNAVIKNAAPKTLYNVKIKLNAPNGWQTTKDLRFNQLSPGEKRNFSFRFTVPYTKIERGVVKLNVNTSEKNKYKMLPVFIDIPSFIVAPEPSLISYVYQDEVILNTLINNKNNTINLEDLEVEVNINKRRNTYIADMSKVYSAEAGEIFVDKNAYPLEYLGGQIYNIRGFLYQKGRKIGESNVTFDLIR